MNFSRRARRNAALAAVAIPVMIAAAASAPTTTTASDLPPGGHITVTSIPADAALEQLPLIGTGTLQYSGSAVLEGAEWRDPVTENARRDPATGKPILAARGGVAWREDRTVDHAADPRHRYRDRITACAHTADPQQETGVYFRFQQKPYPGGQLAPPNAGVTLHTPGHENGFSVGSNHTTPVFTMDTPRTLPAVDGTACFTIVYTGSTPMNKFTVDNGFGHTLTPPRYIDNAAQWRHIQQAPAAQLPRVLADASRQVSAANSQKSSGPPR